MRIPAWEQMGLVEQSRCQRLARHLRRLLAKAEESDSTLLRAGYCWPVGADDIRQAMHLLDEFLPGCDFAREREYYEKCDECDGCGRNLDPYGGLSAECYTCRGTGLLIPESQEEGR